MIERERERERDTLLVYVRFKNSDILVILTLSSRYNNIHFITSDFE